MPLTRDQFAKSVVSSGLLSAEDLQTFWKSLPADARPADGDTFARRLVAAEKLTEFQVGELLAGRATGLVVEPYVLLNRIGAGGMGQVFLARHKHMDRLVAIKLLPPAMNDDEAAVKRFQREVKAAAKLTHPNVVAAFDAGRQHGRSFLVMEYVAGSDLATIVRDRGPLPPNWPSNMSCKPPAAWPMPTAGASSTATSSRAICWSMRKGSSKSSTWVWPASISAVPKGS